MNTATLSDLESDIRHLFHLLDTMCDQQFGCKQRDIDRCDALLWIARDRAEKCKNDAMALADQSHTARGTA